MRRLRRVLCALLFAVPLQVGGAATSHAVGTPPDVGTVQCTASGQLRTNLGTVPQTVTFTALLSLSCSGVGDDQGAWTLSLSGQMSPGFCAGGQGLASVSGAGPDGSLSGSGNATSTATSLHLEMTWGDSDPGGEAFKADLAMTPTSGVPCVTPQTQMNLSGSASITDLAPPPDVAACSLGGQEFYNPALGVTLTFTGINGQVGLNCSGLSDEAGPWVLAYQGQVDADCGVAEGVLAISGGSSPHDGSVIGGALDYERVGTLWQIAGNVNTSAHDHSVAAFGGAVPMGNCVTSPWTGSNISADAAVAD